MFLDKVGIYPSSNLGGGKKLTCFINCRPRKIKESGIQTKRFLSITYLTQKGGTTKIRDSLIIRGEFKFF